MSKYPNAERFLERTGMSLDEALSFFEELEKKLSFFEELEKKENENGT